MFIRFDRIHERDIQTARRLRLCIATRGKNWGPDQHLWEVIRGGIAYLKVGYKTKNSECIPIIGGGRTLQFDPPPQLCLVHNARCLIRALKIAVFIFNQRSHATYCQKRRPSVSYVQQFWPKKVEVYVPFKGTSIPHSNGPLYSNKQYGEWYTSRWRVDCYIWCSEEGPGQHTAASGGLSYRLWFTCYAPA